jgi:glyoxylase-like metal-dependent hydrolase (beta-lactamase superfamily II)
LVKNLDRLGCEAGNLQVVILTHGDFDHIGNALHLRTSLGARLAMHRDDTGMAEQGDMFVNRRKPNILIKLMLPLFSSFGKTERFTPDIFLEDGTDLTPYGYDARVISLPGHSRGSVGILSAAGDLFCGDLFENTHGPRLNSLMDDPVSAETSLGKLRDLKIKTIHPGHGEPFNMKELDD